MLEGGRAPVAEQWLHQPTFPFYKGKQATKQRLLLLAGWPQFKTLELLSFQEQLQHYLPIRLAPSTLLLHSRLSRQHFTCLQLLQVLYDPLKPFSHIQSHTVRINVRSVSRRIISHFTSYTFVTQLPMAVGPKVAKWRRHKRKLYNIKPQTARSRGRARTVWRLTHSTATPIQSCVYDATTPVTISIYCINFLYRFFIRSSDTWGSTSVNSEQWHL